MIDGGSAGLPGGGAHRRTLTEVALDILRNGPGERMTTSLQLQERLDVGSGTVQKALRQLVDAGAVRLRVKGHQGTVIERYAPALLWRAADLGPLRLTLTPPGSIESTALATEVRAQLAKHHVATEFDFVRGGGRRIAALAGTQPRVAALSKVAAEGFELMDDPAYSVLDLGTLTYYRPETLVVLRSPSVSANAVRRVARDRESYDHEQLTLLEFPASGGFEYIDCAFPDVPASILSGHADAGVWHQIATVISPEQAGLEVAPVHWDEETLGTETISHAVLVWRSEFAEIDALLSLLDPAAIRAKQQHLAALGIGSAEVRETIPWL